MRALATSPLSEFLVCLFPWAPLLRPLTNCGVFVLGKFVTFDRLSLGALVPAIPATVRLFAEALHQLWPREWLARVCKTVPRTHQSVHTMVLRKGASLGPLLAALFVFLFPTTGKKESHGVRLLTLAAQAARGQLPAFSQLLNATERHRKTPKHVGAKTAQRSGGTL